MNISIPRDVIFNDQIHPLKVSRVMSRGDVKRNVHKDSILLSDFYFLMKKNIFKKCPCYDSYALL